MLRYCGVSPAICLAVIVMVFIAVVSAVAQSDSTVKAISSPEFKLSPGAEAAGIDGTVRLSAKIGKDGSVKSADILAGPAWPCGTLPKKELEEVRDGIKKTVLASKFEPAMADGKAKEVDVILSFAIGEEYRNLQRKRAREDAIAKGQAPPLLVQGGILNGRAISLPRPEYPVAAKTLRATGTAGVEILIDETGKVIQAGVVRGHPVFQDESRKAACAARFTTTFLDGKPVKVSGIITYIFSP